MKYWSEPTWLEFTEVRNSYKSALFQAKRDIIGTKVLNCGIDTKMFYTSVNNLLRTTPENPFPDRDNHNVLTKSLTTFFMEKIDKITSDLEDHPKYQPPVRDIPKISSFRHMSTKEILDIIYRMPTKHCKLDPIPTSVFRKITLDIIEEIAVIINTCLTIGKFPEDWKLALASHCSRKKFNLEPINCNYRPMSNLTFLSKLVECYMLAQFNEHCNLNKLFLSYQSAYWKFHSCKMSLLNLTNDLLWNIENQKVTSLIIMNLSAAFDTVDHQILLDVLLNQYGLKAVL